jgi:hypothetical protein
VRHSFLEATLRPEKRVASDPSSQGHRDGHSESHDIARQFVERNKRSSENVAATAEKIVAYVAANPIAPSHLDASFAACLDFNRREYMHRVALVALVLIPQVCTSCRGTNSQAGELTHKTPAPAAALPKRARNLEILAVVSYVLDKKVSAEFVGTEPAGKPTPAFDPVSFYDLPHAVAETATTFMLNAKIVQPKPAMVRVSYSVDGSSKSGATVTAKPGRFITGVSASIDDYAGYEISVQAVQDDGSKPDISYP